MSLLRATSSKFSCCSRVLSTLSSVMQKQRSRASTVSLLLANTTNLARYGTQISSRYNWDARLTVSGIWWQSASQNLRRGNQRKEGKGKRTSQPTQQLSKFKDGWQQLISALNIWAVFVITHFIVQVKPSKIKYSGLFLCGWAHDSGVVI